MSASIRESGPWMRGALIALLVVGCGGLWWLLSVQSGGLPAYTVRNRLPSAGGDTADVLLVADAPRSEDRERLFRAIADAENLGTAFFFATEAALEAHQAFLPSPRERAALEEGFLGELRDGVFTPGDALYPATRPEARTGDAPGLAVRTPRPTPPGPIPVSAR